MKSQCAIKPTIAHHSIESNHNTRSKTPNRSIQSDHSPVKDHSVFGKLLRPAVLVTVTLTFLPEPGGTNASIHVSFQERKVLTGGPPMVTVAALVPKPVPMMVAIAPTMPCDGVIVPTNGSVSFSQHIHSSHPLLCL